MCPAAFQTPSTESKSELRKRLRQLRRALKPRDRRAAAQAIARHGQALLAFGKRCGLYLPAKEEIDVLPLLNRGLGKGARCYLPVVPPARQRKLWFVALQAEGRWTPNRYGISEQSHRSYKRVRAAHLDILFLPLLGFDAAGNRIGMGGGYYDATLAYLRGRDLWRKPLLVGVAFECQRLAALPVDPWDVPLDAMLTERGLRRWRR
jgi:5-formyltetrahydrofolate cyclo-ligase